MYCSKIAVKNKENEEIKNLMHKFLHKKKVPTPTVWTLPTISTASKRIILCFMFYFKLENHNANTYTHEHKFPSTITTTNIIKMQINLK